MNYQIITRRWRPQSFKQVIGQKYIIKAICNSFSLKKIHQSWLLSGIRGIGKTTISRLIAKSLNCKQSISKNPCLFCDNCKDIEQGCFLDLIEIDAASKTKIEDIKEILEHSYYAPYKGRFKIYLIDEAHMLSKYSFNFLLKLLEEPPQHVKFILSTTNKEKIPNTIISRCISLNLQPLSQSTIYKHLKHILKSEKIIFDKSALYTIAEKSSGSVRDSLNILEQAISMGNGTVTYVNTIKMFGILSEQEIFFLTAALFKKDIHYIFNVLYSKRSLEINWDNLLVEIMRLIHYIAIFKKFNIHSEKNNYMYTHKKSIKEISEKISMNTIQNSYNILINGRKNLLYYPTLKIGCEITLLKILNNI